MVKRKASLLTGFASVPALDKCMGSDLLSWCKKAKKVLKAKDKEGELEKGAKSELKEALSGVKELAAAHESEPLPASAAAAACKLLGLEVPVASTEDGGEDGGEKAKKKSKKEPKMKKVDASNPTPFKGAIISLTGELWHLQDRIKAAGATVSNIVHKRVKFVCSTHDSYTWPTQRVRRVAVRRETTLTWASHRTRSAQETESGRWEI